MPQLDPNKLREIIGFVPTPAQADILAGLKRSTTLIGGRRVGKSYLLCYLALREVLSNNRRIWIVSPFFALSKILWSTLVDWSVRCFPNTLVINKSELTITNQLTGSILELKSADNPVSLKGRGLDLLILDEAGDIGEDLYSTYLQANISECRPELGGELGRVIAAGNAPYSSHWFALLHNTEQPDKASFTIPTAVENESGLVVASNNPDIVGIEILREIRASVSERTWRQQYLAQTISGEGTVFSSQNVRNCIGETLAPPKPGRRYVCGIDLGRRTDFTVLIVIDVETHHVVYMARFQTIEWPHQRQRIIETARWYNNARVIIDETGLGDVIVSDLKREKNLWLDGVTLTNESKQDIIEKLAVLIEQRRIFYPNDPVLVGELEQYEFKMLPSGRASYSAPSGLHDDTVIALALAAKELGFEPKMEVVQFPTGKALQVGMEKMLNRKESSRRLPKVENYE